MQLSAERIVQIASEVTSFECLHDKVASQLQNQLVFFFKPELFLASPSTAAEIIGITLKMFDQIGIKLSYSFVLSGSLLEESGVMDRHYGEINALSRSASSIASADERRALQSALGVSKDALLLGGHEVLQRFPRFDWRQLDELWSQKASLKVRSGFYAQSYDIDGAHIIMVNGFHPAQLAHFTQSDRRLALFVVNSDLPWNFLRRRVLGDTYPERAAVGSLRCILHQRRDEMRIANVSVANNFAHLSAGPFEALAEMKNFLSSVDSNGFDPTTSTLGRAMMTAGLGLQDINRALANSTTTFNQTTIRLFDVTEESDTLSAVSLYKNLFHNVL